MFENTLYFVILIIEVLCSNFKSQLFSDLGGVVWVQLIRIGCICALI